MFKKSNRNFRTKKAETDESDNDSQKSEPIQQAAEEIKSEPIQLVQFKKKTIETATTILSFGHEINDEENCEEFKVKKSRESRRIAKELKKSKKEKLKQQNSNESNVQKEYSIDEDDDFSKKLKLEPVLTSEDVLFNEGIKVKPLKVNQPEPSEQNRTKAKYLVNKYGNNNSDEEQDFKIEPSNDETTDDEDEETIKLDRLRREMEVINGEEPDPIENETDEQRRSMKLLLKAGIFPDANIIHAARKKRELARQGDYIPINSQNIDKSKSRLVREDDENDLSEDEDNQVEESRISLNYKQKVHIERQKNRDNFLAYENGSDDSDRNNDEEDEEDEDERWEREQIRKGVQISQTLQSKLNLENKGSKKKYIPSVILNAMSIQDMDIEDSTMYDLERLNKLPEITFGSIKTLLRKNINLLSETHQTHLNEHKMRLENLSANQTDLENLKKIKPSLDKQYVYYQEMKAFLEDFIDCYNEKIAIIDNASVKFISLLQQRADKITSRRQQDFKDQSIECSLKKTIIDLSHEERISERELRRAKNASNADISDHEQDTEFESSKQQIIDELNQQVVNELNEEFYKFDLIKLRFEKWKLISLDSYRTAYVSYSLPKLFSPLIKYELIDWNPLEDSRDIETSNWFKELIIYDKENMLRMLTNNEPSIDDCLLIPHIIEKTVLLRLIDLADVYDPISSSQTTKFTRLIFKLINEYPTLNSKSENTKKLMESIVGRIRKCLDNDLFIPLYPKQIIEQRTKHSSLFFYYQFKTCIKLFGNLLQWKGIISDKLLKEFTLDCLLNRYIMIGLQSIESHSETIETIETLINKLPKEWLKTNIETTNSMTLPQLLNMIRLIRRIADSCQKDTVLVKRIKDLFTSMGASDQVLSLNV